MSGRRLSLFARTVMLIVAVIAASQLASLVIFRQLVQKPRLERMAEYVQAYTGSLRMSLAQMTPSIRAAYIAHMLSAPLPGDVMMRTGRDMQRLQPTDGREGVRLLLKPLARSLGRDVAVRWQAGATPRLWVRTQLDRQPYWLGFSVGGWLPNLGLVVLLTTLVSIVLALAGALWMRGAVRRPLQQLADAARALGRGRSPQALPRAAPPEIAQVAESFERMAQSLMQADSDRVLMLAGVSHDLRTPLAKMRLCVEMLRGAADAELIGSMERSIGVIDGIIGQFIDFARVGTDEVPQTVDMAELARTAVAELAPDAQVRFEFEALPPATVRPVAMRRLLANLVENARRHAGGEIVVRLRVRQQRLELAVLDRGPGIHAAERERVQQPFVRVGSTLAGGAGLGLAIVARIASLHSGRLDLLPREGGGLEARILLDVLEPEGASAAWTLDPAAPARIP